MHVVKDGLCVCFIVGVARALSVAAMRRCIAARCDVVMVETCCFDSGLLPLLLQTEKLCTRVTMSSDNGAVSE